MVKGMYFDCIFIHGRYDLNQWVGCILVSVGIFISTLADAAVQGSISFNFSCCGSYSLFTFQSETTNIPDVSSIHSSKTIYNGDPALSVFHDIKYLFPFLNSLDLSYLIGISLLFFALLLSAVLAFMQEDTNKNLGRPWQENLFFTHLFSLPMFFFFFQEILSRFESWWLSPYYDINIFGRMVTISIFWMMVVNAFSQYLIVLFFISL